MRCNHGNRQAGRSHAGRELLAEATDNQERPEKPLRPRQCHKYLQKTLASQFTTIVSGFISEAQKGGCAHMKLAVDLLESPKSDGRKSSAQRLLEELGE